MGCSPGLLRARAQDCGLSGHQRYARGGAGRNTFTPLHGSDIINLKSTLSSLLKQVLRTGMKHRHVGSHELNIESSRSHSIMTVNCCVTSMDEASFDYGTPRFGQFPTPLISLIKFVRYNTCLAVLHVNPLNFCP